ncbi:hypothetical protein SAY87_023649 [Trapa incisa]|uniref:DYW domain-containing protein n=1 Tax=Trapa incisa TaxID=236973 RepID=A0AAN7L3U2_9MYRT|nr:hypothetical protein SAY87_023649 [Trapa incisa]
MRLPPSPSTAHNHPLLQLLRRCGDLPSLRQVHALLITTGLALHTFPLSRLLSAASRLSAAYSLSILDRITNPTVFLFNILISSATPHHPPELALSHYLRILASGRGLPAPLLFPNSFTYPSLFKLCRTYRLLDHGHAIHAHALKFLDPPFDHFVQSSLLCFYAITGRIDIVRILFDQIEDPDLACWNSVIDAYTRCDFVNKYIGITDTVGGNSAELSSEALSLFVKMLTCGVRPNEMTAVAVIIACANSGALYQGKWIHRYILKNGLKMNVFVATALIDMYSKCGCLDLAYQLFDKMPHRDILSYNAMIGGFAIHGHGHRALELFDKMKHEGLMPDNTTFVVTLCACSHVGLVEEGRRVFRSIKEDSGIDPKMEHYGCLVDLLGRSGQLEEALETVQSMPMKPNAVLWRSLLGAARVQVNLEIGEVALKNLLQLEPEISGNYVLLSNMYAASSRWDDASKVRQSMKDHGIDKVPGMSLVEIDGTIHEFLTGDRAHPNSMEIYYKLEEINGLLQEHGHRARTRTVMFDIEEEEKEDALSYHSERLAIAFALITMEPGIPIRITKNLRVCEDCHAITKLISVIYEREIIVRDRIRFHDFKGGACSCSDHW